MFSGSGGAYLASLRSVARPDFMLPRIATEKEWLVPNRCQTFRKKNILQSRA